MTQGATEKPAANAERDAERPPHLFKPGQSGNPAGKKPGTRNRATRALEELLEGQGAALTQKAIDMALAGDVTALKLCIDRIYPPRKDRPVEFPLAPIHTARDAADVMSSVMNAVATGQLTPADASEIAKVVTCTVKSFEAAEFADRLAHFDLLTDAQLNRIAAGASAPEIIGPRLLTIGPR
jgi:hypothetical protein